MLDDPLITVNFPTGRSIDKEGLSSLSNEYLMKSILYADKTTVPFPITDKSIEPNQFFTISHSERYNTPELPSPSFIEESTKFNGLKISPLKLPESADRTMLE